LSSAESIQRDLGGRIRDTFLAPRRLAARLVGTAPWVDALLVSTVVALLMVATAPDDVFIDQMRDAVTRRGQPVEITSPPAEVARWGRYLAMLGTLGTHPLVALTLAGVLTLVFTILGGGQGGFREFLSLTSHAMLIPAAGSVVAIVVRLSTGMGPGGWGGAFVAPGDAPNLLLAALLSIDPFIIWMLVVIGIGIHGFDPRRSAPRATLLLVGTYFVVVVASTALLHPELQVATATLRQILTLAG